MIQIIDPKIQIMDPKFWERLSVTTPCFFELCTIWIRRHTVYVSVAVESKTAVKLYG